MLSLKSDFVETFCQVYLEKHKPYKFQKLVLAHQNSTNMNKMASSAFEEMTPATSMEQQ